MEPVFFVMAILGCGDDGGACRPERVEPARFTSFAACQAAMPEALMRSTDLAYPVVAARCERRGVEMVSRTPPPRTSGR